MAARLGRPLGCKKHPGAFLTRATTMGVSLEKAFMRAPCLAPVVDGAALLRPHVRRGQRSPSPSKQDARRRSMSDEGGYVYKRLPC